MNIRVVILAAGQGKRMQSRLPKVLHRLAGKPLLQHVIETANCVAKSTRPIVVVGHESGQLRAAFSAMPVEWVEQKEQLGTGHALQQALPHIQEAENVLVLYGDVPLISAETLTRLIQKTPANTVGLLTAMLSHPQGYGRVQHDARGNVTGVVEEKDANANERAITEINTGIYLLPVRFLKKWLPQLKNDNAQHEYYLTDIISLAARENISVHTEMAQAEHEIMGVNDRSQLAHLERCYQQERAEALMRQGATLLDPARVDVRGEVKLGRDVVIDVNVIFEGCVTIGDDCVIGANTILRDTVMGDKVEVKPNSLIEGAEIAAECVIGPFARIRPGTVLALKAHVGNFVEIKKSHIGEGSKVNHLSYIGDSDMGKRVNIGAGTITCNYDGMSKHKTIIGDDVFIGSDTQLVAPVTIGIGATIGAGSTVTKDVPPHQLTLTHQLVQRSMKNWERPDQQEPEKDRG